MQREGHDQKDHGDDGQDDQGDHHDSSGTATSRWLEHHRVVLVHRDCYSVVAVLQDVASLHLLLELEQVVRLDGVHPSDDVPVDEGVARRRGDGSLVDPSALHVDRHHQVTVRNLLDVGVGPRFSPLEAVEELVYRLDDPILVFIHLVVVVNREKDTHSCILDVSSLVFGQMNSVHLQIISFPIHCVFGPVMKMELNAIESSSATKLVLRNVGLELLQVLALLVDGDLRSVAVPDHGHCALLIGIELIEVVFICIYLRPAAPLQVNRALVRVPALVSIHAQAWPICSVLFVVPFGSRRSGGQSECRNTFENVHLPYQAIINLK